MHYGSRPNSAATLRAGAPFASRQIESRRFVPVACRMAQLATEEAIMGDQSHPTCLPKLVGAAVIAESTGWTSKHVYELAQRGQIPHYRIGGSVRFDPIKVKAWLDAHEIAA